MSAPLPTVKTRYCSAAECFMAGKKVETHLTHCLVCDRELSLPPAADPLAAFFGARP